MHLARALAQEAPLLLLDEPIAGLDIAHQLAAMDLLRATVDARAGGAWWRCTIWRSRGGAAIASCCSRRRAAPPTRRPADVLTRETLARVFGVRADVRLDPSGRPIVDVLEAIASPS